MVEYIEEAVNEKIIIFCGWQGPGWYFWDEFGSNLHGPFDTEDKAFEQEAKYYNWMAYGQ